MSIRSIIFIFVFISASDLNAAIYKCTSDSGKLTYSDKPCINNEKESVILLKNGKSNWVDRLRNQKPPSIDIISVMESASEVTIKYKFRVQDESTKFMRKAHELSGLNVSLKKIMPAADGPLSTAIIKISDKKSGIFFNQ